MTKHQQPFNYVQYNPEIVVRAKLNLINYLQQKSEIVVMAQLKPFNNSRQNYVIAVMAKLQHFKYFTSIHELSSWQVFFIFGIFQEQIQRFYLNTWIIIMTHVFFIFAIFQEQIQSGDS